MEEKKGFFYMFFTSIYDLDVFSEYAKEGITKSIIYAVLMITILGSVKLGIYSYKLNNIISGITYELKSEDYNAEITNGMLKMDRPYDAFQEGGNLIYFDSDINVDEYDKIRDITIHEDTYILFLRDGIIFNSLDNPYVFGYDTVFNSNVSLGNQLNTIKLIIIATIFILKLIFMLLNFLINCLIVALVAGLITLFMRMIVKRTALYSLTIYAATLPFVIQIILEIIKPDIDFDMIFIAGTLTYMILILRYIKLDIIEKIKQGKIKG